jgi:tetratricopeptide (TPR) repeat protein
MKHLAWAAVVFFFFAGSVPARDQTSPPSNSPTPQIAPQTPRAKSAYQAQMAQAQRLMAAKDYESAIRAYTDLTHDYPQNYTVWNMLGIALQQIGQVDEARSAYARATKVNPKYSEAYNNIGTTWYQEQKYGKALRAYQKSIAANPNLASAYSNMGCAYFSEKKYPQALAAFNKAIALDPDVFTLNSYGGSVLQDRSVADHGTFYFLLAKSYAERNDAANCAEYLRKAFDEGYKTVAAVKADPSFAKVLADPAVQAILDKAEASANAAAKAPPSSPGT